MRPIQWHFVRFMSAGILCAGFAAFSPQAVAGGAPNRETAVNIAWDWSGVIGTGQSLAVGEGGRPLMSTNQPYGNLKLSTDHLALAD